MKDCDTVVAELESMANPDNVAGMVRFGINPTGTLGVSIPALRTLARRYRHRHDLALELWATGIHEARILAGMIADPKQVTPGLMDAWTAEFDSWDTCDQVCSNLWEKTPFAYDKAVEYSQAGPEFIRRAGFVLMARLAVGDKGIAEERLAAFLPLVVTGATDERNFVKKAVNWALRQIGKRSPALNTAAVATARDIAGRDGKAARWIAADALRELTSEAVQSRLKAGGRRS